MKIFKALALSLILIGGFQTQSLYGQLGKFKVKKPKVTVPKLKSKKGSSSSTTTSSSSSTSTSSSKSKSDKPKYDPEDPTYQAYSRAGDGIRSAKSYLEQWDFERTQKGLDKAKKNIDILKETPSEKNKEYLKVFEADHAKYTKEKEEKLHASTQDKIYDDKIEAYYKWAVLGWEIQDKTLEPSYKGYYAFRKDFEEKRPKKFENSYVQKRVKAVDEFFKVKVYERLPGLEKDVDNAIKRGHRLNSSGDEDYLLNAHSRLKDFEKPLESIKYKKKFLLEDKTEINRIEAKLMKEKAMLDEYVNSGKCDAHRAKHRQAIVDAVRVGKKGMSNAKYESMAKKGVEKGTPLRVVVTSSTWYVKKNDFGYPLYKTLGVDIVVKKEGKCYLAYGQIKKTYEGGGKYGGEFFKYWAIQEEMNCANINK
jgi:hypothetical protein